MALIGDVLFPEADQRRTLWSTLAWWEARRGTYNVVVGAAGLVTLAAMALISIVPPGLPMHFDWRPVAAYGLLANVCYTLGFAAEIVLRGIIGKRAPSLGPALFRQGLAFSVGLTLLPIIVTAMIWGGRLVLTLLG